MSLDAYRGFVMLLMVSSGFGFPRVAREFKESGFWQFLGRQFEHVPWTGCSLWDLIQPSFMFIVGVAVPFSLAVRRAKGQTFRRMTLHAAWRAFLLVVLAIFLTSYGRPETQFSFTNVLAQIGLGYWFLFMLGWTKPWIQFASAAVILVGYWVAFATYPAAGPAFDYASVGLPANWSHLEGFAAHWDKNTNLAAAFDRWFLNLFPQPKPFVSNSGGYQTLNFVPSLATMVFGLLAGELLRSERRPTQKFWWLIGAGVVCLVIGKTLDVTGVCPSVKRIWTPSWTVYSAGWTCLLLAAFYWIIEMRGWRAWAFPFMVVGMNSIAIYCMAQLSRGFVRDSLKTHLGKEIFESFGKPCAPIVETTAILLVLWLICLWMYRRKIFLRI